jgi:hypothetical protein
VESSFCKWLKDIEDALWRMIMGIFQFIFLGLPEWVYRVLVDTVRPVTIRLMNVFALLFLWLTVVFGPVVVAVKVGVSFWVGEAVTAWVILALGGSLWGLFRIVRKRKTGKVAQHWTQQPNSG